MTNYGAELDELVAMLEDVGLIDPYVNEDGKPALRLTESGTALGRALAMGEDADAGAVLDGLLDATGADA